MLDVTLADSIDPAMEQAEVKFDPIHVVVSNTRLTATRPARDQDERAWDGVVDTNL
jgi:NAD(P)-dependent dehydrogenase (short-subunit alcohol dehydrogenase family)